MSFLYYYPNRPKLIPIDPTNLLNPSPDYLFGLEASGKYIAEQKWNGDNTLIYTGKPDEPIILWNRTHNHLAYQPSPDVMAELKVWKDLAGEAIINCETVNRCTATVKNLLIVHCIMAWQGELLAGKTWGDSRNILDDCVRQGLSGIHVQVSNIWRSGFWNLFQDADGKIIEGIILKDPKGKLVFSTIKPADQPWMLKIRKSCEKYDF
jgi:hypothetical protein